MRSLDSSPSSSPIRKRQRLSSPTYDEQVADLRQEDLEAFDALEAQLSQCSQSPKKNYQNEWPNSLAQRVQDALNHNSSQNNILGSDGKMKNLPSTSGATLRPTDDPDNPFTTGIATAKINSTNFSTPFDVSFTSASNIPKVTQILHDYEPSPSPEESPKSQSFDSWFEPASVIPPVAFLPASSSIKEPAALTSGFMKASNKGWIAPSSAALAKAQAKMKDIWDPANPEPVDTSSSHTSASNVDDSENAFMMASNLPSSPRRLALRAVENSLNSPSTPSPLGFSRPSATTKHMFSSPVVGQVAKSTKPKPFKPPLLTQKPTDNRGTSSPLNPASQLSSLPAFTTAGSRHPLASAPITLAATKSDVIARPTGPTPFTTPARIVQRGGVGLKKDRPSPFVTPFKPGMKPGQTGHSQLEQTVKDIATPARLKKAKEKPSSNGKAKEISSIGMFDLTIPPNRTSLASFGLQPQQYNTNEIESMGIDVAGLSQVTPVAAVYYSFHTATATPLFPTPSSNTTVLLGPAAALKQLLDCGCSLATKPWVDNHWCLILWKLAGMVALDPERESDPTQKRWCWSAVMRQLFYRYERELQGGIRPPLRVIATQDAPASYPIVLCISGITWSEAGLTDDGMPITPYPELEVTDGWYRLRAQVDAPLARAIRRGVIRIGRKIGVAGAKLSSERKDPSEVLEAYNSTKLVIFGNSSHMAPWHAKLGFQKGPCISTLHSLTADGGVVSAMDLVVIKAHPIAFFEFMEDKDGKRHREGPLNESEESLINEQWKRRREVEEAKLRLELDKKLHRYEGYIDRLQRRAGAQFRPGEDDFPPDHIESLYDELEDPADAGRVLANLTPAEAGWLARYMFDSIEKERARAGDEIESELKNLCPPREVRCFRVLIVQDSRTLRRPAHRKAQLTVWDVLQLTPSEGHAAGTFETGQRYLVTNLMPTQPSAWMGCEPGSEVYLSTRRDSRWTTIKSK